MNNGSLPSYGIREKRVNSSGLAHAAEEIRINGYTVLPGMFDESTLATARRLLDEIHETQRVELGGEAVLESIQDASIVRSPLVYDDFFLQFATHPQLLSLLETLLGEYFILMMQNANVSRPQKQNYQHAWHRDLNYQHFVSTRPLAISAIVCLDGFYAETGGTMVLSGTHREEVFPSDAFATKHEQSLSIDPGSVLVFDSMLFHRAGQNTSGQPRRGLIHVFGVPILRQQVSLPRCLGEKYRQDPLLYKLLGYEYEAPDSPLEWRKQKLEKLARPSISP